MGKSYRAFRFKPLTCVKNSQVNIAFIRLPWPNLIFFRITLGRYANEVAYSGYFFVAVSSALFSPLHRRINGDSHGIRKWRSVFRHD